MSSDGEITYDIQGIAEDLIDVRQRGVDRIDIDTTKQPRRDVEKLERLARDYCRERLDVPDERIAQITVLLKEALIAYRAENEGQANFLFDLLFDAPDQPAPQLPSKRLDDAMRKHARGKSFDNIRNDLFTALARFLIRFVGDSRERAFAASVAPVAGPAPKKQLAPRQILPRVALAGVIVVALLLAAAATVWIALDDDANKTTGNATPGPTANSSTTSSPPLIPGKTYPEQQGSIGANTFKNPRNPSVTGPKVEPFAKVDVSCKVFAPTIQSLTPDGYWYRLASPPWNNNFYAAANTFMNGDIPGTESTHHTDWSVPDCDQNSS